FVAIYAAYLCDPPFLFVECSTVDEEYSSGLPFPDLGGRDGQVRTQVDHPRRAVPPVAVDVEDRLPVLGEVHAHALGIGEADGVAGAAAVAGVRFAAVDEQGVVHRGVAGAQFHRDGLGGLVRRDVDADLEQVVVGLLEGQ